MMAATQTAMEAAVIIDDDGGGQHRRRQRWLAAGCGQSSVGEGSARRGPLMTAVQRRKVEERRWP
jgi:hypothetical protein